MEREGPRPDGVLARRRPSTFVGWVGVGLGIAVAVGLGVLRWANAHAAPVATAEWAPLADVALGGLVVLPSVLAILGLRGRPVLLLAGGILALLLALPFTFAGLVLIVPGVLFLVAYGRMPRPPSGSVRRSMAVFVPVVLGVGALAVLFATEQPVCYRTIQYEDGRVEHSRDHEAEADVESGQGTGQSFGPPGEGVVSQGGGCTSDVIVPWESAAMLGLSGTAALAARRLAPVEPAMVEGAGGRSDEPQ